MWAIALLLLGLTAYLGLWPVPVQPVSWKEPPARGYSGPHAVNGQLANLQIIPLRLEEGPEHVVLARDGKLYAAMASGNILRMNPDGSAQEVFANTGGRVLGFDFDAEGNLVAADAIKGLLSISPEGNIAMLADAVGGDPIRYADAVVVPSTGRIYFSDASTRFAPGVWGGTEASMLDIVEQSSTGRILEYDPASKGVRIVARGLSFANGVALSKDEQSLFVNETGKYRVWKIAVESDNLDVTRGGPQAIVLFDNLPGYPDNLMRGLDGKIWLGFAKPRNPVPMRWRTSRSCASSRFGCRARYGRSPLPTGTCSHSRRMAMWWPTCRTQLAPTQTRPASPKPRTGSTYRACMLTGLAGYPAENALLPAYG